jgi:DNA primase
MEINQFLLTKINNILGDVGKPTTKGNYSYYCPSCNHKNRKLEINFDSSSNNFGSFACWVCHFKSKSVITLLKKIKSHPQLVKEVKDILGKNNTTYISEQYTNEELIELPKEFISLSNINTLDKLTQIQAKHAIKFLHQRNITDEDIIKYNIGFCSNGKYEGRVIIPSYDDEGKINYYIARDYNNISSRKYKNPPIAVKNIIGFELYINWNAPIILCEGIFDALTIKRNVIPLFGKVLHEKLMMKLVKSEVNKIYIALDDDAIKDALKHCEQLMSYGKKVYLVEMKGKDANEIGYENFLNTIENTYPLTFHGLMSKKLELI